MKKILVVFTFFIFASSIILSGLSDIQTKNIDVTNKTTYTQNSYNQHDCASSQNTKDCHNACETKSCDCVNHSCSGTTNLLGLAQNYHIIPLPSNNGFSSTIDYTDNDLDYPIIHPPRV